MEYSDNTKAILLLTGHFDGDTSQPQKPLTLPQWNRLRKWLYEHQLAPQDLFHDASILQNWTQKNSKNPSIDIIHQLLNRGPALAEASLQWQHAGIWTVTYLDNDFPQRIKDRIDSTIPSHFPPLLFGIGNRSLLQGGGIAVVGSRNAPQKDLDYTRQFGIVAAHIGIMIVSGGAKGVDITAMNHCMEEGGKVIGILSNNLLKRSIKESTWRDHLENDQLLLLSRTDPKAKLSRYDFSSAAMERNKYMYCLSDSAVVVRSGLKGGTISGANENLRYSWVPLWVKPTSDTDTANEQIILNGAYRLSDDEPVKSHLQSILGLLEPDQSNISPSTDTSHEVLRKAVILLTVSLKKETSESEQVKPLDMKEWEKFVEFLKSKNITPAHLLNHSPDGILRDWDTNLVKIERIKQLADQGRQDILSQDLKDWRDMKIHIAIRPDKIYPKDLKAKLWHSSPPVLFIVGYKNLLQLSNAFKIAVMGSRQQKDSDLGYAELLGNSVASQNVVLISTYQSEMEERVVNSSLDNGGKCILVLKKNIQKALQDSYMTKNISQGSLAILSASPPQANTPLDRCYDIASCLSSAVLVLRSGKRDVVARCLKRSTQNQWSSIFQRPTTSKPTNTIFSKSEAEHVLEGKNAKDDLNTILKSHGVLKSTPIHP